MLTELTRKLQDVLAHAELVHKKILSKGAELDGREANLIKREEAANSKDKELTEREGNITPVENLLAAQKANEAEKIKLSEARQALNADILKFKQDVEIQNQKLANEKAALVEISNNNAKEAAKLEKLKGIYKQDVLAELAKRG